MKKLFIVVFNLTVSLFAGKTVPVEESEFFRKHVEPETGVVSYILEAHHIAPDIQSIYFTHKSMTDDGRFLVFHATDMKKKMRKHLYVLDLKKGKFTRIVAREVIPFLDVKRNQVYYITIDGLFRHDLETSPAKAVKLCDVPAEIKQLKSKRYLCTHLTLTHDRKKAFLDVGTHGLYVQGMLDISSGKFTEWGRTDFYVNHGQIHPYRDDIALCAWEALKGKLVNGVYPRMWLMEPGNKRTMIPSVTNYATHERWSEDGKGFYFCSSGVYYHELASGRQYQLTPMTAAHAAMTADNKYLTFDNSVGGWYRGCAWQIGFYNRKSKKGFYFYPKLEAYNTQENPSTLHPDPHPQFVCNDKYIISTVNLSNGHMDLSVTPVAQLIERTQ